MRRVESAIVGAGFAGIGMALALQKAGRTSFVVLERAESVGGTWRDNTYPGVACDVPSHLYGFADHPHADWSTVFASGEEIRSYLEDIVRERSLDRHLRLGIALTRARWTGHDWLLETSDGGRLRATYLMLGCGRLTEPLVPDVDGLETFAGPAFHSARWDHGVTIEGKRVGVVGTGASAVQLVPELARRGASVTLLQRTPAWIVPRGDRAHSLDEREHWDQHPADLARLRQHLFDEGEERFASRSGDTAASRAAQLVAQEHLARQVEDPLLREHLTPRYAFGCKRVLLSDDFYPAVASGAVTLEPSALRAVRGPTLVAASGARHDVDVLVLATGFASARQPFAQLIEGERCQTLADHWHDGMTSLGSTLVHGFPNLFVLNGPNASLGHSSAILMLEQQIPFVVRLMRAGRPVRVTAEAEEAYTREIVARSAGTPWVSGGCRNWYVDERSGRLTLLWPGTVADFNERLARIDASAFEPERPSRPAPRPVTVHEGALS